MSAPNKECDDDVDDDNVDAAAVGFFWYRKISRIPVDLWSTLFGAEYYV